MAQSNRHTNPSQMQGIDVHGGIPTKNDEAFQVLQEMFHGKVEPEVVYMILTEMDWNVHKAIDTLQSICGESSDITKKESSLHKLAQDILCKRNENKNTSTSVSRNSSMHVSLPSRSRDVKDHVIHTSKSPDINDHAIASNNAMSTVGLERRKVTLPTSTTDSPIQRIRNAMASTYGTHPESTNEMKDRGKIDKQPTINPLSVDDDITTDHNLLSQSILSGALNLSSNTSQPEISPLSPSKMYNPFTHSVKDTDGSKQDSHQAYADRYWPDLSGKMWPNSSKDASFVRETGGSSTNIFPGMYTDDEDKTKSNETCGSSRVKNLEKLPKKNRKRDINFQSTSLLERLGLAEKNDKGQLKNLQTDPEEDLDLNFSMETFDLENDDSSSDGSLLSHSGSADTMTNELKNMLGLSKEEKKEPTMLESAARELERLNALSPNAKEFVPRSTAIDTSTVETTPKFLTPKCALPAQPRNLPPYAMVQQPPHLRPVSMFPVNPFSHQIVPVSLVGLRNVPPPNLNMMPPTSQMGSVMPPPPPNILRPPSMGPVSSPSPPVVSYSTIATSPSMFSHPSPQQLASEVQQYATVAAQQITARHLQHQKEASPSPERYRSPDISIQNVKDKVKKGCKLLIILRGLPGSGKSTLARELCEGGVIVSADDYFMDGDVYCYDQRKLTEAHDHCRKRALDAVQRRISPVIIDNTNTQVWEMCPYVDIAKSVDPEYEIEILEPTTPWKFKARKLSEKSEHGVPYESIKKMLDRYQRNVTVDVLLTTKSKSRPTKVTPPLSNDESTKSKQVKKATESKNKIPLSRPEEEEDIWEDVGSIKWKNYYAPLEEQGEEENVVYKDDDNFSELKIEEKKVSGSNLPNNKGSSKKNRDAPKLETDNTEKTKTCKAKNENENHNAVSNEIVDNKHEIKRSTESLLLSEKVEKKGGNFFPMTTGLGFQMKTQKSLASLQKQIELISQQKTLVSSNSSGSPVTVQLERTADHTAEEKTSRTASFEKVRSEDKKFDDEIHELVDGLIAEHVEDKKFSNHDLDKVQEELKAFLHIMPIDQQQREDAECLIEHKLSLFLKTDGKVDCDVLQKNNAQESHSHCDDMSTAVDNNTRRIQTSGLDTGQTDSFDGFIVVNSDDIGECYTTDVEKNSAVIGELPSEDDKLGDSRQCSEELPPETDKLGVSLQCSETVRSNVDKKVPTTGIEVNLENIIDVVDDTKEIDGEVENPICHSIKEQHILDENESRTFVNIGDCSGKNSNNQCQSETESTNCNVDDCVKEFNCNSEQKDSDIQKYGENCCETNSSKIKNDKSLLLGLNSDDNRTPSDGVKSQQLNDITNECLDEHFWELDNKTCTDIETSYWENGKRKLLDEADGKKVMGTSESDSKVKSENNGKGDDKYQGKDSSPTVWDEPKSKREKKKKKKKSNRDSKKFNNTNISNDNSSSENNCQRRGDLNMKGCEDSIMFGSSKELLGCNKDDDNHSKELLGCNKDESKELLGCNKDDDNHSNTSTSSNKHTSSDLSYSPDKCHMSVESNSETIGLHSEKLDSLQPLDLTVPSSLEVTESEGTESKVTQSKATESEVPQLKPEKSHKLETTSKAHALHSPNSSYSTKSINKIPNMAAKSEISVSDHHTNVNKSIIERNPGTVTNIGGQLDQETTKSVTVHSNVDKASFLVKHYENFGNESSLLSTCSLSSLKKVNVALTIDSECFQQKCEMLEKKAEKCHSSKNQVISADIGNVNVHSNHTGKNEHLDGSDNAHSNHTGKNEHLDGSDNAHSNHTGKNEHLDGSDNACIKQDTQNVLHDGSKLNTSFAVVERNSNDSNVLENSENDLKTSTNNIDTQNQKEGDVDICSSDINTASENIENEISGSRSKNDNTELVQNQVVKDNIKVNPSIAQESIAGKIDTVDEKNTQGVKKKKKTNTKRKMAAKFPEKFIDDSVKEAFLNNDWATQMPKLEGSAPLSTTLPEVSVEMIDMSSKVDSSTTISSEDLIVLSSINDGNSLTEIEDRYQIRVCRNKYIIDNDDNYEVDSSNVSIPVVIHPDKGTMTESMCIVGLDFLHSSFPYIPEQELKDILERCDGDVEWAVNLLLDWKYHLTLTDEESDKLVDEMFKAQNIPKSPVIHSTMRVKSVKCEITPPTLLDMCYSVVMTTEHDIDGQEIEQQLICSSVKRLNSLEKQLSVQTKLYSFSSFGDEIIEDDSEFTEALLKELMNSAENKSLSSESHESSQISLLDEDSLSDLPVSNDGMEQDSLDVSVPVSIGGMEKDSLNESVPVSNGCLDTNTKAHGEFWNVELDLEAKSQEVVDEAENLNYNLDIVCSDAEDDILQSSEHVTHGVDGRLRDQSRTESFGEPTVSLPLKNEFTKALFSLFGPIEGLDTDKEEDMTVPVTLDVAKLMHTCMKKAFLTGQLKIHSDQQLLEDEAYARQLQEEENEIDHHDNRVSGPVNSTPQSSSKRIQQVVGINIDKSLNMTPPQIPKVVSLTEIMNEEREKENEKRELVETLRQSGSFSAMSTRLKQQKLYDQFPGIDQTVLDDIYHANCCNLVETVKAIEGSLGCSTRTPKTVMSKESEYVYEKHMIEAAKQQSLQEMVNSCLHVPTLKIIRDAKSVNSGIDYEEFRGEAQLHYRLRHECFQKAQDAHRRGMQQVSSFYSQQGHVHTKKIKDANMRASEQILATRHDMLEKNSTLDLHGLHVDEAIAALERILPSREFELQSNPFKIKQYLIVVTGKGSHSRGGVSKLKPAVTNYLRRNDYRYSEIHEGALRVSLKH